MTGEQPVGLGLDDDADGLRPEHAGDTCCRIGPDGDWLSRRQEERADDRAAQRLITVDQLADALTWGLGVDTLAQHLHVDERTVRARIRTLTDDEKAGIDRRLYDREDAA